MDCTKLPRLSGLARALNKNESDFFGQLKLYLEFSSLASMAEVVFGPCALCTEVV